MKAKDYLLQIRNMTKHLERLQNEIEGIMASVENSNSIGDGTPKAAMVSDRVANVAVRLAELRNDYQLQMAQLWEKRKEIVSVISQTESIHSELLYYRYICFMKWEDIADEIHMDESYTRGRLHGAALMEVEKILQSENLQQKATTK